MGTIEGILLGVIQGLTEFLPVSSSGHLVIFQDFFGVTQPGITFEVMVHFGTLLSVIWVFGGDLMRILTQAIHRQQERHFALMLLLCVIPTAFMGFFFSDIFRRFYESTITTGFMLLITGAIIYTLSCLKPGKKRESTMQARDALFIGVMQGLAIIPGISRSGSTITAATWRGLDRETAVKFSFLVSVPVIFGATILELKDMSADGFAGITTGVMLGTVAAFVAGIFAIKFFIHLLQTGRFHYFAYYCWFAGVVTIFLKVAGY